MKESVKTLNTYCITISKRLKTEKVLIPSFAFSPMEHLRSGELAQILVISVGV